MRRIARLSLHSSTPSTTLLQATQSVGKVAAGVCRLETSAFDASASALNRQIGTSSKEAYDELRRSVDDATVKSEPARLALEAHVTDHCC